MRQTWVLGLWVAAAACGGKQTGNDGTDVPRDVGSVPTSPVASDAWRAPAQTETPPIPAFPDLCSRFGIVRMPRAAGDESRELSCPCAPALQSYNLCDQSSCVTSFSCDAWCASLGEPGPSLFDCMGNCEVGVDYGIVACVQLPGGTNGTFGTSGWCLDDSQCYDGWHCVAVTTEGFSTCTQNAQCNTQSDCGDGLRCALPDDSFLGYCGDGRDGSPCFDDADCRENARCRFTADSANFGLCSSGAHGSACATDDDCSSGTCLFSQCNSGIARDRCLTSADCQPGLHCQSWGIADDPDYALCSDGSVWSTCQVEGDCAPGLYCSSERCQDGSEESPCDADAQCQSGRCQLAGDFPTCTSGQPGSRCMDADDCISGSCYREPGLYDWTSGRCD